MIPTIHTCKWEIFRHFWGIHVTFCCKIPFSQETEKDFSAQFLGRETSIKHLPSFDHQSTRNSRKTSQRSPPQPSAFEQASFWGGQWHREDFTKNYLILLPTSFWRRQRNPFKDVGKNVLVLVKDNYDTIWRLKKTHNLSRSVKSIYQSLIGRKRSFLRLSERTRVS